MASICSTVLATIEQRAFAGAGTAAAHVHRRDRRRVEDDSGDAGSQRRVVGMADANAGNVGEEIFQAWCPLSSAIRIIRASSGFR